MAIKFLHPQFAADQAAVARFLREVQAAARLKSHHVALVVYIDTLPMGPPTSTANAR